MTRAYAFVNFYMGPRQQGIQVAHALTELAYANGRQYRRLGAPKEIDCQHQSHVIFHKWVQDDKVLILLDGGTHKDLKALEVTVKEVNDYIIYDACFDERLKYDVIPYSIFHEGVDDLNGAATCLVLVASDQMVELIDGIRNRELEMITDSAGTAHVLDAGFKLDVTEARFKHLTQKHIALCERIARSRLAT